MYIIHCAMYTLYYTRKLFSAHPDRKVRVKAVNIVHEIRMAKRYEEGNRHGKKKADYTYRVGELNFKAKDFTDMVFLRRVKGEGHNAPQILEFRSVKIGGKLDKNGKLPREWIRAEEPPLTLHLTDEEIDEFLISPLVCDFPCHSQSVEHGVALTTRCVKRRRTEKTQLMAIYQTQEARRLIPGRITYANSPAL